MKLREYHRAKSINEVVLLIEKSKKNIILGGTHWLKMGKGNYNTGIDISALGLDKIEETQTSIEIGAYASLREVENNEPLRTHARILSEALASIVGVQFRNTARIGASVFSKFGFSDVTAALLTMDTWVEINGKERVPLESYQKMPRQRHFLTRIIIVKEKLDYEYHTMRQSKTSLPYMILATSLDEDNQWRISVGARPAKAILAQQTMAYLNEGGRDIEVAIEKMIEETSMEDNIFASKDYREYLAGVFLKRGVTRLWK